MAHFVFHIGTYSKERPRVQANGRGIYRCSVDSETGAFAASALVAECSNPSYLISQHRNSVIYAVSEMPLDSGAGVTSYAVDESRLRKISRQPVDGSLPCHIALHPDGNWLATAQYGDGGIALFPVDQTGSISPSVYQRTLESRGLSMWREDVSRAHFVAFMKGGNQLSAVDLGKDAISFFEFSAAGSNAVSLKCHQTLTMSHGSAPRHFVSLSGDEVILLLSERDESIAMLVSNRGFWREESRLQPLGIAPTESGAAAAIKASPDGRHVYASFRRQSCIVGFEFDAAKRHLKKLGHWPTGEEFPRDFALTPDGGCLVTANQRGNRLTSALRNSDTGELSPTSFSVDIGSPTCICF